MTDQYKIKRLMTHHSAVICPGCGMEIRKTDDMSNVEYVRTKRKTDVFFFIPDAAQNERGTECGAERGKPHGF